MSINRAVYVICGYNLSTKRDSVFTEELYESKLYEDMTYNQRKGNVQCFDDPMYGDFLYVGYILGVLEDDYNRQLITVEDANVEMYRAMVDQRLAEWNISGGDAPFKLMVFNYFT